MLLPPSIAVYMPTIRKYQKPTVYAEGVLTAAQMATCEPTHHAGHEWCDCLRHWGWTYSHHLRQCESCCQPLPNFQDWIKGTSVCMNFLYFRIKTLVSWKGFLFINPLTDAVIHQGLDLWSDSIADISTVNQLKKWWMPIITNDFSWLSY